MSGATIIGDWSEALLPPPLLSVSEWADAHRMLPETSAARGSRWRTASTPYLSGIMNAVLEPGVRKVAVMGAAQVGKSEALHNVLGYFIAHDPCPTLFVHPTVEVAEEWSKDRLADMLRTTDVLRDVVSDQRVESGRRTASTLTYKVFPNGFLALGGANTPNTFARRAARLVFGDDVDRFPAVVGEEGDPADLLENRVSTFIDGVVFLVSTPTLAKGRIDSMYHRSDQRKFHIACPRCGREDWITWNDPLHFHVVFEDGDPRSARLACPDENNGGCGERHDEPTRRLMVLDGQWRPTAVASEAGLVGFHLPAMYSTLGEVTLQRLSERWLAARARGKESLRVFINTVLAEGWEDRGARMNPHKLTERCEDYGPGVEVPAAAVALTAGVDVQDNRFEMSVYAWGMAAERWLVDHRVIPGNTKSPEIRAQLLEALNRKYTHALGPMLPIHSTCIDTGHSTDEMYEFVLAHEVRRIYAVKGVGRKSGEPIVMKPAEKRSGNMGRPVRLYPLNVDDAKSEIMGALSIAGKGGPGYCHFPRHLDTVDEEFFAQLCAEHRETIYNKGGVATHFKWVEDRDRNEALDCAVYALAAYRLLNPNIRQMLESLRRSAAKAAEPQPPTPATAPPPGPPTRSRRFSRSSYLEG